MDLADDIAYSTYDMEDAYKANLLSPLDVFSAFARLSDDRKTEFMDIVFRRVSKVYKDCEFGQLVADSKEALN